MWPGHLELMMNTPGHVVVKKFTHADQLRNLLMCVYSVQQ